MSSPYRGFITRASRSADAVEASVADNCRFDERAGDGRWEAFEALLPEPGSIALADWNEAYRLHLERTCKVPRPFVPDTFLEINRAAWLEKLSENQSLVRIEALSRPLQRSALEFRELEKLLQQGDDDAMQLVRAFLVGWNQRRDARPAFAAFADEVRAEMDDDDWPHALRDRLGLGHYGATDDAPMPIALMRYSLEDVLAPRNPATACAVALPTVLDGGMHEFFFPAPCDHAYGATVHLVPSRADTLTAEVVHCRIDYERRHICRVGEISRPAQLDDAQLREARDLHLYALREACGRDDFGEPLEGRT